MNTSNHAGSATGIDLADLMTYPSQHGTLVRLADVKCALARATPQHSVTEQDSIDTPEFRSMMIDYRGAGTRESAMRVLKCIISHIDSRAQPLASTAATQPEQASIDWIYSVVRDVSELDRDSPEDEPDMLLVTADELFGIIRRHAPARAALAIPASTAASEQAKDGELRTYRQALEIIGIRDCADPVAVAGAALVETGFWAGDTAASGQQAGADERCPHCDGTGDVHRADGEWMGECTCEAGVSTVVDRLKIAAEKTMRENEELRAALSGRATIPSEADERVSFDAFMQTPAPDGYDARNEDAWHIWQGAWQAALTHRATTATPGYNHEAIVSAIARGWWSAIPGKAPMEDALIHAIAREVGSAIAAAPDIATTAADQQGIAQLPQSDPRSDPKSPQSEGAAQAQAGELGGDHA